VRLEDLDGDVASAADALVALAPLRVAEELPDLVERLPFGSSRRSPACRCSDHDRDKEDIRAPRQTGEHLPLRLQPAADLREQNQARPGPVALAAEDVARNDGGRGVLPPSGGARPRDCVKRSVDRSSSCDPP
jgi:hypothetical protein